jgi:hypothetical protein
MVIGKASRHPRKDHWICYNCYNPHQQRTKRSKPSLQHVRNRLLHPLQANADCNLADVAPPRSGFGLS